MSVTVAKTAGFCFGVRRAVDMAEQQAGKDGVIYAYGEDVYKRQLSACSCKVGRHGISSGTL